MSTLKDKLANSVRQARTAANLPEAQRPAPERAPRAPKAAAATVPPRAASSADAQNPAPSANEVFPRRVWPD